MRALAIMAACATAAGAEPAKPFVATFNGATHVLPHGRLMTSGERPRFLVLTEAVHPCTDAPIPADDFSVIAVFARDSLTELQLVAFKMQGKTLPGHGTVEIVPVRDRSSTGTLEATGTNVEGHGAFDLVVCPKGK